MRTRTKPAPTVGRPLLPRDAAVLWWLRVLDWIERTQDELQDPPPDSAAAGMQEAERRKLAGSLANFEFSWSNNRPAFDGGTVASTPLNVPRRAAR